MTKKKLSPNEKAKINRENYAAYVANLLATNTKFPVNQFGDANISLIAKECGFKRGVIQNKDSLMGKQFQSDLERIGTEVSPAKNTESKLEAQTKKVTQNASKLEKELERTTAEVEQLRKELALAQKEITLLINRKEEDENKFEHLFETGRRAFS